MADKYPYQVNAKIGDHLVNINGDSAEDVVAGAEALALQKDRLHAALSALDGRPATEIVQKEKTWGARSQGGRTYPNASGGAQTTATTASGPAPAGGPSAPQQLLQQELGAQVIGTETTPDPQVAAQGAAQVPHEVMVCPLHGPRKYFGPGVSNKTGNAYGASYRCTERGCASKPPNPLSLWQNPNGSWTVTPRGGR